MEGVEGQIASNCEFGNEPFDRCTESNYIVSIFLLLDRCFERYLVFGGERGAVLGAMCG